MKFFSAMLFVGLVSTPLCFAAPQEITRPGQSVAPVPAPPSTPAGTGGAPVNAPAQPVVGQPANTTTYVVGPEDNIAVNVWKEPTFSGTFPVRPDGMISVALVGDIKAAGRTPMDLANDLTERLKKFITDPTVTVTVLAVNSKRVYIMGEVARIGPVSLTSAVTPLQAIASAGGLTVYANRKHIYILRGEQGKQKKIPFDYNKAIKDGNMQGVVLLPGDTIVVP